MSLVNNRQHAKLNCMCYLIIIFCKLTELKCFERNSSHLWTIILHEQASHLYSEIKITANKASGHMRTNSQGLDDASVDKTNKEEGFNNIIIKWHVRGRQVETQTTRYTHAYKQTGKQKTFLFKVFFPVKQVLVPKKKLQRLQIITEWSRTCSSSNRILSKSNLKQMSTNL